MKTYMEIFLVISSASLVRKEILQFGFYQTFIFDMDVITEALEDIVGDSEMKTYGTGSNDFDEYIREFVLDRPGGLTQWYWVSVLKHYVKIEDVNTPKE